jgi:AraC-like DNA-binding protein
MAEGKCKEYYLKPEFLILTGFTVEEYVRNRRLTLAAQELVATLDYSSSSFSFNLFFRL